MVGEPDPVMFVQFPVAPGVLDVAVIHASACARTSIPPHPHQAARPAANVPACHQARAVRVVLEVFMVQRVLVTATRRSQTFSRSRRETKAMRANSMAIWSRTMHHFRTNHYIRRIHHRSSEL